MEAGNTEIYRFRQHSNVNFESLIFGNSTGLWRKCGPKPCRTLHSEHGQGPKPDAVPLWYMELGTTKITLHNTLDALKPKHRWDPRIRGNLTCKRESLEQGVQDPGSWV